MSLKSIFSATNGNEHRAGFKVAEVFGIAAVAAAGAAVIGVPGAAVGGVAGLFAGRAVANGLIALRNSFIPGL